MSSSSYDCIVVGAGAGGAAVAWALAKAGKQVLILEAGPRFVPEEDYRLHLNSWEEQRFPHKPGSQGTYRYGALQLLDSRWSDLLSWNIVSGRTNQTERRLVSGVGYEHVRGVGGSTLHFTGEAHRLNPASMKMNSQHGVAADWPLDYDALEPLYQEVESVIGVAGSDAHGDRWRSLPFPLPAHPLSRSSEVISQGGKGAGFNWRANSRAALSKPYDGRPECNYCANCNRGCPRRDKGSADVTFIPKAIATGNCTVWSGCQVLQLMPEGSGKVGAVLLVDNEGQRKTLMAEIIVLSAGAIETPRLLLASKHAEASSGIGNESGLVGKNFMETLFTASSGFSKEPLDSFKGLPSDAICWDFNRPDSIPGIIGGCRFSMGTAEADLVGPINYAQRIVGGWGKRHKQTMRDSFGRAVTISSIGESLPNPGSFIDLDPEARDAVGMPLARIQSHLPEMELQRLTFMRNTCREMLKAGAITGLVEEYSSYDFFSSTHVFGTCRMGNDPDSSVVDVFGRCHHWKNLYIADASVFPSSGGGESPSLTIQALAVRTGRQIAENSGV